MQATLDAATALDTGDAELLADVISRWEPARPLRADEVDFERFFREHHRVVYAFALHLVGDPAQAEDVASEVLVKVYLKWEAGRVRNPRAYLRRAVVNHTNSWLRRKQVERRYLERQPLETGVASRSPVVWTTPRCSPAPWAACPRGSAPPSSCASTRTCPRRRRPRCSVGTVKSQVHRGIAKLREVVGPEVLGGPP